MNCCFYRYIVVEDDNQGTLCGTVTRKVICTLIKHKAFGPPGADPFSTRRISPLVNWQTLECIYPRYPEIEDLQILESERLDRLIKKNYCYGYEYSCSSIVILERVG